MRALSIWIACVLIASLSCAQTAPPPFALRSNEEVLAAVDDATASELRFILGATYFADGGVGIAGWEPRAAIAYQRLLKSKNKAAFLSLCYSETDVAALYGLKGIAQLEPDSLRYLIAKFARRREPLEAMSGCIGGDTSLASEALEFALSAEARLGDNIKRGCVRAWLEAVRDQGARHSDESCAWRCLKLSPEELDRAGTTETFAKLLAARRESEMLSIVRDPKQNRNLRQLCTDYFARSNCRKSFNPARFDRFTVTWTENQPLDREDEWQIIVSARAWQLWAPINSPMTETGRADDFRSAWQNLTPDQWEPLIQHRNLLVREAAKFLKRHPVTGLAFVKEPPAGDNARRLWLRARLASAESVEDFRPVLSHLMAHPEDYPFCRAHRGKFRYFLDEDSVDVPNDCAPELGAWALAMAQSSNPALRQIAYKLVSHWLYYEVGREIQRQPQFNELLKFLREDCNQPESDLKWEARNTQVSIFSNTNQHEGDNEKLVQQWARELAKTLVTNPRQIYGFSEALDQISGRAIELLGGLTEGRCHFLPDDEWDSKSEPETDSPEELLIRMKAALAKLD